MTCFRTRCSAVRFLVFWAALALVAMLWPQAARAQLDVSLRANDPPPATEKEKFPPPTIEAIIKKSVPGMATDQFVLEQIDATPPVKAKALKIKRYVESNDRMALVILIQGNETWMGNDTYADELGESPTEGAFSGLGAGIDEFVKAGPPGSVASVLIYADGKVLVKQGMDDASKLSGTALGTQRDYRGVTNAALLIGLDEAIALLDQYPGYRKILVTIGDGTGQEEDLGGELNRRREELQKRGIESFTIFYEVPGGILKADQGSMKKLGYTDAQVAVQRDNFASLAARFVGLIGDRYYATFPGCNDEKPPKCFTHDGQRHEFTLAVADTVSEPLELQTKLWEKPKPPEETSLWWLWLLLGLSVVGLIVFLLIRRARNQVPAPMPMPIPEVPMAPSPAGPAKTIMLNMGGGDQGMPVVSWIVPLDGPNQFQTFKLLSGVTKIGTGGESNIIINDSFMSTEHATITATSNSFMLKDNGSTNGTYINDKRISSHDLVDNDVFVLGKTHFVYKSVT